MPSLPAIRMNASITVAGVDAHASYIAKLKRIEAEQCRDSVNAHIAGLQRAEAKEKELADAFGKTGDLPSNARLRGNFSSRPLRGEY